MPNLGLSASPNYNDVFPSLPSPWCHVITLPVDLIGVTVWRTGDWCYARKSTSRHVTAGSIWQYKESLPWLTATLHG